MPLPLLMQWHITDRCNGRCAHCYQNAEPMVELPWESLLCILEQFKAVRTVTGEPPCRRHITLTGGEPFLRQDIFDLLAVFHAQKQVFSYALLTNGSLLDSRSIQRLRKLEPRFVQLSLDGGEETHDRIRGPGNFRRTIEAAEKLVRAGIPVFFSFTVHQENREAFPAVVHHGRRIKATRIWADRLIPMGAGVRYENRLLSPTQTRRFFEDMQSLRGGAFRRFWSSTDIAMHRALQFLVGGGRPYRCSAGRTLITVMPNGDLYPCRRMPIKIGNLLETDLRVLFDQAPLLRKLRDPSIIPDSCRKCRYARACGGGLRCLSYALTGDPFRTDPGCWMAGSSR